MNAHTNSGRHVASRPKSKTRVRVTALSQGGVRARTDQLATEEPLEIRLLAGGARRTVAVTMRTPGADFELAAGFLFAEGVIRHRQEIAGISYCVDAEAAQRYNVVNVRLHSPVLPEMGGLERHFYTNSACGVCGKASLEALELRGYVPPSERFTVTPELLLSLPGKLREAQGLFEATGGLHAAALFSRGGALLALREDVGRHNALDKLIGWALLNGMLPLDDHLLLLSGRASFELLQKSLAAGVPLICAVSAPSSLAVSVAREFGLTLVGFLRDARFNVYAGEARVALSERVSSR